MSRQAKLAQEKIQHSQRVQDNEDDESKRHDRNLLEKKRRDKFNGLIDELASCLADRCHTKRSTEKSSILKLTSEYFLEQEKLAAEKAANELIRNVKPAFVTNDEFDFVYLESMNMLVFALDQTGKVVYIADNTLSTLGHLPDHILQRNVFEFIDAQDHFTFQGMLSVLKDSLTLTICPSGENIRQRFEPFWCQFRRGPFGRGNDFETICCFGSIVRNLLREDDENFEVSESLIVLARPLNVPVEKTLLKADGPQTKFTSTLNMDAKYDYLDKRVAAVLGFFPSELTGSSLYEYCHVEDLDDLVEYHKVLLLTGRITTSYYRHLTKGQSWVWLRSRYHLSYNDWTSKPQAVTCLTWVVPFHEVCAKQAEILMRDRESFAQILNGTNQSIEGKSTSSNSSMNLPAAASPGLESEVERKTQSRFPPMRRNSVQSSIRGPSPESWVARTPGSEESQSNCTLMIPCTTDMGENQPINFQESFQFLKSLNLPMDLTGAQQSLHQFLLEKYMQIINAVNKQMEQLSTIQKQIKIQGEIRDLVERLEKEKSANDVGNEYNTTKEMLLKFEEMRRVCSGTQAVKPTAESVAICSKRLQEIDVQSRSEELEYVVTSEENQQMTKEIAKQNDSPMQVEQPNSTQTQQDVFFNQERWLQTQAQQAQMQQQALLVNRSQELECAIISEENQHMTNEVEGQSKSPMQVVPPNSTQTQPVIFFNQERWLQTQPQQAHSQADISINQQRQWFQTETQQAQLQQQAILAQQMINSQHCPQDQLMLFQQQHLLAQQLHQKQLEEEARRTLQQQQQSQLINSPCSSARSVSRLINSPNTDSPRETLSGHSGMTNEPSLTNDLQQNSSYSPDDCLYDYQWF